MAKAHDGGKQQQRISPLYTSKAEAARKKDFIQQNGRDSDGAYRLEGRAYEVIRKDAA